MSTVELSSEPPRAVRSQQTAVPWTAVRLDDPFWAPRVRVVRERTLPALYRQCLDSGRIDALRLRWQPGQHPVPHRFWDSDIAKFVEACSYSLAVHPDAWLASRVEDIVGLLRDAQQPDGYLNTFMTQVEPANRWMDLRDGHELYCAGHLIEAGVAHFLATGRRDLLDVVSRYADYIATVFGRQPGQKRGYCGHPEIELALVRLYAATGQRRFLDLSAYFVEERGREPYYFDQEASQRTRPRASDSYYRRHGLSGARLRMYNQSHAPVREQTHVVGHAVRAMYLYSAMADLARETADDGLFEACERLWQHLVSRRMYVTGGIGSSAHNEGFTADYELPNDTAYAESCASVGLVFWAHRMLQLTGDGRYADAMENVLYNAVAGAMSWDGDHFSYANPLASDGRAHRQPWFRVACCPPNVARLLTSLGQYVYSVGEAHVAIHLFMRGEAQIDIAGGRLCIRQTHDFPWDNHLAFDVQLDRPATFGVWLRIPGWSRGATLRVNGDPMRVERINGYARIERTWTSGDEVRLELDMPAERLYAHPSVAADAGRTALRRGPIVYCIEQADHSVPLDRVVLPRDADLRAWFDVESFGGVTLLGADALASDDEWGQQLYRVTSPRMRPVSLLAVPYAVWDNRSAGRMQVWIQDAPSG